MVCNIYCDIAYYVKGVFEIMETKVKTTLNLDKEIIRNIKLVALNRDKTQTEVITQYLKQGLMNEKEINKKNKSLNEIAGIFKGGDSFDSVKEVRKLRNKD